MLAALLLGTLGAAPARSQPCDSAVTQPDMNACADRAFHQADAGLNAAYGQVIARLTGEPEVKQRLVAAQRAWIGFRDAECEFVSAGAIGGSVRPMVGSICLEALTKARTKQIDTFLHCPEGDSGCPVPAR